MLRADSDQRSKSVRLSFKVCLTSTRRVVVNSGNLIRQPVWCQTGAIGVNSIGVYSLYPGLDRVRLEQSLWMVNQRIQAEERALGQAERMAERADRKANTNRARENSSLFSTRRSLQSLRAGFSDLDSTLAENSVQKHVREVERLYTLKYLVEDALIALQSPLPNYRYPELVRTGSPVEPSSVARRFCTSCGSKVQNENLFCSDCGLALRRQS